MKTLTPRPQGGAQEPTAGPVAGSSPAPSRPLPERPPLPPGRDLPSLPWLEGELGWLARELRQRGCESPTLCSDALQLEGQLRLGQRDPLQRREVLCWVESAQGQAALARARESRALVQLALSPWSTREIRTVAREHLRETRAMDSWPLWVLQAVLAKLRAELVAVEPVPEPYWRRLRAQWERERREARDVWRESQKETRP